MVLSPNLSSFKAFILSAVPKVGFSCHLRSIVAVCVSRGVRFINSFCREAGSTRKNNRMAHFGECQIVTLLIVEHDERLHS